MEQSSMILLLLRSRIQLRRVPNLRHQRHLARTILDLNTHIASHLWIITLAAFRSYSNSVIIQILIRHVAIIAPILVEVDLNRASASILPKD